MTMLRYSTALEAKVAAVNVANAEAMRLYPLLAAVFRPLVGSKVVKTDGTLLESVKRQLPKMPSSVALQAWVRNTGSSLALTVKTCMAYGDCTCTYHEADVYLVELDAHGAASHAKRLYDAPETKYLRADWMADEVTRARNEVDAKREALREAESALGPFGMYDR